MGEVIKTWLEILIAAGTVSSILWKFAIARIYRHIRYVQELLSFIPAMVAELKDIRKKIYPNGGSSLDDKLTGIQTMLHYQQESLKVQLKLSGEPICRTNPKGEVIFVNYAWLQLAGYSSPEDAYGTGWIRAIHADDRERLRREWEEAVDSTTSLQTSFRIVNIQTGKITEIKSHSTVIRDLKSEVLEYFAILTPVT